jgi:drug/metabolite transporter (DMT)-like permease
MQFLYFWIKDKGTLEPHLSFVRASIHSLQYPRDERVDLSTSSLTSHSSLSACNALHNSTEVPEPLSNHAVKDSVSMDSQTESPIPVKKFEHEWGLLSRIVVLVIVLTIPSYAWYLAAGYTSMSNTTAIYNTSCAFAYGFSILLQVDKERLMFSKIASIASCLIGVAIISFVDTSPSDSSNFPLARLGDAFAFISAITYGFAEALYKRLAVPETPSISFGNFVTGCIGIGTLVLGCLPIPLLHWTGMEIFELPTLQQTGYILLIALMGLCFNACFLLVIAFTSPVEAAVGIMLTYVDFNLFIFIGFPICSSALH